MGLVPVYVVCLTLDFQNLEVADTEGREVDWRYDGNLISVCWADSFVKGEQRSLKLIYLVQRPTSGIYFVAPDSAYPLRDTFVITGSFHTQLLIND